MTIVDEIERFVNAFANGEQTQVNRVYGRFVRTKRDVPIRLADHDDRKFVMVLGPSGLQQLLGKSGFEVLVELGFTPADITRKVAAGNKYKLVVFQRPDSLRLGSWNGVAEAAAIYYPEFAQRIGDALPALKSTSLRQFESLAGFNFAEIHANGPDDDRFMTPQRLRESQKTPVDIRRFLYDEMHLSELFAGTGRTQTHDGKPGVPEYIMANDIIESLPNYRVVDVSV